MLILAISTVTLGAPNLMLYVAFRACGEHEVRVVRRVRTRIRLYAQSIEAGKNVSRSDSAVRGVEVA